MKNQRKTKDFSKGITLIALIITIIVLLILVTVTINMLLGSNGIISKAQIAKERTNVTQESEKNKLGELENRLDSTISRDQVSSWDLLYENYETEAQSGTLNKSINNYDLIAVIYYNVVGVNSTIFNPKHIESGGVGVDFSTASSHVFGSINFNDNNFNINIEGVSGTGSNWAKRLIVYEVRGIKF